MTATQKTCTRILARLAALLATQGISPRLTIHTCAWDVNGSEHAASCRRARGGWKIAFWTKTARGQTASRDVWLADEGAFARATHDLLNACFGA
jgi:hypothetical protein